MRGESGDSGRAGHEEMSVRLVALTEVGRRGRGRGRAWEYKADSRPLAGKGVLFLRSNGF